MHFHKVKSDQDRLQQSHSANQCLDSCPTLPEHQNWRMREREKKKEIGPNLRFGPRLQIERVTDQLSQNRSILQSIPQLKSFMKSGSP